MIIAIDGPAGAGKSTVSRGLAKALGFLFLDTGAMYRAVALKVLESGANPESEAQCRETAERHRLSFDAAGKILIDGTPGEPDVRSERVEKIVSAVSAHPRVRAVIVARQQAIASAAHDVVAEGRDTTTVVFPNAELKLFLNASAAERARRKAHEVGKPERQRAIESDLLRRDTIDSTRAHSPLVKAPDALVIETDGKSPEQVIAELLAHVHARRAAQPQG
ncbi:MAG: (d)CMP kinase [Planctomycetes bacterium]|nr:(d)CMP kinase [Planctomycetota bacterium]